jgi:hypothetical protein
MIQYSLLGRTAASIGLNVTFRGLAPFPTSGILMCAREAFIEAMILFLNHNSFWGVITSKERVNDNNCVPIVLLTAKWNFINSQLPIMWQWPWSHHKHKLSIMPNNSVTHSAGRLWRMKVAEHNRVQLIWVPGHRGIDRNEMADHVKNRVSTCVHRI